MKFPLSATLRKVKRGIALTALAGFLAATPGVPSDAATTQPSPIPHEYGKVVYRKEGNPDQHLYIICQSHRNAQTGANGDNTAMVQAEIYRLGEWLIHNEQVDLLLPEGYFYRRGDQEATIQPAAFTPVEEFAPRSLDDAALHAVLSDTSVFVNADKLLKESYNLKLQQVEDEKLYFSVLDILFRSGREGLFKATDLRLLHYLQEKRSAVMLQAIPEAIDREMARNGSGSRKAIFTIGMAHADEMIRFLKEGRIAIDSPLFEREQGLENLKLIEDNYTVTVIVPRTLAEDREALRIANLGDL
jgi:hypothetical protein